MNSVVQDLLARPIDSELIGGIPTTRGGNVSAKGIDTDPTSGEPIDLLWVKGSGGDLGTLTESGLAVLRLDRCARCLASTRDRARGRDGPCI